MVEEKMESKESSASKVRFHSNISVAFFTVKVLISHKLFD